VSNGERTVVLGEVDHGKALGVLGGQDGTLLQDVANAIPKFKQQTYATFKAEYDFQDGVITIHFFLPERKVTELYWKTLFAQAMEQIGTEHFQATKPRLIAKYTPEMESWWFRAQGYSHIIDIDAYVLRFFERLAECMAPALQTQSEAP